jgi:hypothetical protein
MLHKVVNEIDGSPLATGECRRCLAHATHYRQHTPSRAHAMDSRREVLTCSYDPDIVAGETQTTCGEYLELIPIHCKAFAASPLAYAGCSAGQCARARAGRHGVPIGTPIWRQSLG